MGTKAIMQQIRAARLQIKEDFDIKEIDIICKDFTLGKDKTARKMRIRDEKGFLSQKI